MMRPRQRSTESSCLGLVARFRRPNRSATQLELQRLEPRTSGWREPRPASGVYWPAKENMTRERLHYATLLICIRRWEPTLIPPVCTRGFGHWTGTGTAEEKRSEASVRALERP